MHTHIFIYTPTDTQSTHDTVPPLFSAMKVCGQKIPIREYFSVI